MTATPSTMLALGTEASEFTLPNVLTNELLVLGEYAKHKPLVIIFMCNHCPFVLHILNKLVEVGNAAIKKDVAFVAISANDIEKHPNDAPEKMQQLAETYQFQFPYCYDESQQVAKAYNAACTPDFYVFSDKHQLVYRGQFDDARPGNNKPVTGADLIRAIDAAIESQPVDGEQYASIGCNIKWKA